MTSLCLMMVGVALSVLWLSVAPVLAETYVPIFDKRYVRAGGTPVSASDTFAACDPAGTFRMVVVNGPGSQNEIATDPLSSGSVSVNGVEVVRENDLNQNVSRVERALSGIGTANRLDINIRSGPAGVEASLERRHSPGEKPSPAPVR
jgi:hypothetical protein